MSSKKDVGNDRFGTHKGFAITSKERKKTSAFHVSQHGPKEREFGARILGRRLLDH